MVPPTYSFITGYCKHLNAIKHSIKLSFIWCEEKQNRTDNCTTTHICITFLYCRLLTLIVLLDGRNSWDFSSNFIDLGPSWECEEEAGPLLRSIILPLRGSDVLNTADGCLLNTLWGISLRVSVLAGLLWTGGWLGVGDLSRLPRYSGDSRLGVPFLSIVSELSFLFRVFILKSVGSSVQSDLFRAAISSFGRLGLSKSNNKDLLAKFVAEALVMCGWLDEKDLFSPLECAGGTIRLLGEDREEEAEDRLTDWRLGAVSTDLERG